MVKFRPKPAVSWINSSQSLALKSMSWSQLMIPVDSMAHTTKQFFSSTLPILVG